MCSEVKQSLNQRLEKLAFKKTIPFCYSCYQDAPTGRCKKCMSDDLMRHLQGYGVEFGTDWVIKALIEDKLEPQAFEDRFESHIDDIYGTDQKIGWLTLAPSTVIKNMDPISWDIAKSEYISGLEEDEEIVSFDNGSNYYDVDELEKYLESEGIEIEEEAS